MTDPSLTRDLASDSGDADPNETAEWRDAFTALVATHGPERARFILDQLAVLARHPQVGWSPEELFGGGWSFAVGVNNLFDERPPPCYSCDLNSLSGTIHSIGGTFWYLRASFEN